MFFPPDFSCISAKILTLPRMRPTKLFSLLAILLAPLPLVAQQVVELGSYHFIPEQNAQQPIHASRGTNGKQPLLFSTSHLGQPLNGQHNALIQLAALPSAREFALLAAQGIVLGDYVGGNAYYALIREGATLPNLGRSNRLTSAIAIRPEWKLCAALQPAESKDHSAAIPDSDTDAARLSPNSATSSYTAHHSAHNEKRPAIPDYARAGDNAALVVIRYASNATLQQVATQLQGLGLRNVEVAEPFRAAYAEMPLAATLEVAKLPWVLSVGLFPPPPTLLNNDSRALGRASLLGLPATLGGRGLEGKGMRIGIWDANISQHVDFGGRVHVQEYEVVSEHGSHVTGTVLGAGYLDPDGRGMAPKAEAWTYNFNTQKNGLTVPQEMAIAQEKWGITLTQNSYGLALNGLCDKLDLLGYRETDLNMDRLAERYPTLTHIFAVGNDQQSCQAKARELYGKPGYGTLGNRAKNVILVGALDRYGRMENGSSWGPQDDGRLAPTLCAKGEDVWSTISGNGYASMSGTSMACPGVTGSAALVAERYAQLHQGQNIPSVLLRGLLANTATDAGRPGPDFQYGYGVLNAEKAVVAVENGWYNTGSLEAGKESELTIAIPEGTTGIRAMLVWTDPTVAKTYKFRDRAVVNDLNLKVRVGTTEYLPWVCDHRPEGVEQNATRQLDSLNNMEQVTLNATEIGSSRQISVSVEGKVVTNGQQEYTVTWYFERAEPRVVSPAAGSLCLPGGTAYLALEGVEAPYDVELSYNDGQSWLPLGRVEHPSYDTLITIPADAPLTSSALVRVFDAKGRVARSSQPFTISPRATGLRVERPTCGVTGWKLSWVKVDAAVQGYVVLLANPDRNGDFEKIGETNTPDAVEFLVPTDKLAGVERPVFSVAVKLPNGSYGKRAKGVSPSYAVPVMLTANDLPFETTFERLPPVYFNVKTGEHMRVKYITKSASGLPAGSNTFGLIDSLSVPGFNTDDYFDETRNAKNMGSISMCDLDLSMLTGNDSVLLHISGVLDTDDPNDLSTARMRVRGGVDGGQTLTSLDGKTVHQGTGYSQEWYYWLAGGQHHKLVIEFSGKGFNDVLGLTRVAIERPTRERAVRLTLIDAPKDGANLGEETFKLMLENQGVTALSNLLIKVHTRGKWVKSIPIPLLKGMERTVVEAKVDLATREQLGELVPVHFTCEVAPLNPTVNAELAWQVNSMGCVVPMGSSYMAFSPSYGWVAVDPRLTYTVKDRMIFTDNGGALRDYTPEQESTIKFLPADPHMRVRVRFIRFNILKDNASLRVYTVKTPATLRSLAGIRERDYLTGERVKPGLPSLIYTSEADDGGVTLHFSSKKGNTGAGWIAEVEMVPGKNPLSIAEVVSSQIGEGEEGEVPITIKVLNRWNTVQKHVAISVLDRKGYLFSEWMDLQPGENTITLNHKVNVPVALPIPIKVTVEGDDTDASDNELETYAIYDRYCTPSQLPKTTPDDGTKLQMVETYNHPVQLPKDKTGAMRYTLGSPLAVYSQEARNELKVTPFGKIPDGWSVALWVDWDGNGQFDEEQLLVPLAAGNAQAVAFSLAPKMVTAGLKRARLMLGATAELGNPCSAPTEGDLQDFAIELHQGLYERHNDLELTLLSIGQSGKNLSNNQEIRISLSNLSNVDYNGKLQVKVTVDGNATDEEIDLSGANALQAYVGFRQVALTTHADFSAAGRHTVRVELVGNPVEANNVREASVDCIVPASDGFYALSINTVANQDEKVAAHSVGKKLGQRYIDEFTTELVFRLEKPQYATLMAGKGYWIYCTYGLGAGIPDNSISVVIAGRMLRYTPSNVVKPGVWHHLTVVVKDIVTGFAGPSCNVQVFIDGVEQPLRGNGAKAAPSFGDNGKEELYLCPRFAGQLKLFRAYEIPLKASEIKPFTYVRKADGTLPRDCVAEFAFNEGPGNWKSLSGGMMADIISTPARIIAPTNGLWQKPDNMVATLRFDGQAGLEQTAPNAYTVLFDKGAPKSGVKGMIVKAWPMARLEYNGAEVTDATAYDFSTPIKLKATASPFGYPLTQEIELSYREDKSKACELLSLKLEPGFNNGLTTPVELSNPGQTCILRVPTGAGTITDPKRCKLTFTVSALATLELNGATLESGISEVDLSHPKLLTVVAENGIRKHYSVELVQAQSLTWDLAQTEYTYGDSPVDARIILPQGGQISTTSSRPEVASLASGKLAIGVPGITTITASLPNAGGWAATSPISKQITVRPKAITARVKGMRCRVGYPIDLGIEFEGLVNPLDAALLQNPLAKGCFTVQDANGNPVNTAHPLPAGIYAVKGDASKAYTDTLYRITPADGSFEVEQADRWRVQVTVRAGNSLLEGASVLIWGKDTSVVTTTTSQGQAVGYLASGKYAVVVGKAGYSTVEQTLSVLKGDADLSVALAPATVTLTYSVDGAGGYLAGPAVQKLAPNTDGEPIMAVPEPGYAFSQWDDNVLDNPRQDTALTENKTVKALFAPLQFTLRYKVGKGGKLKHGLPEQTVGYGLDGQKVEVEPEAGYYFRGWSDGVQTTEHTAHNVTDSLTVTALFGKYITLPDANDFEAGTLGEHWYTESVGKTYNPWFVANTSQADLPLLHEGYFAVGNSYRMGAGTRTETYLYSPRYTLEGWSNDLVVGCVYSSHTLAPDELKLQMQIDQDGWHDLYTFASNPKPTNVKVSVPALQLGGKGYVQFRWRYACAASYAVELDNIVIMAASTAKVKVLYMAEPAGAGTFDRLVPPPGSTQENIAMQEVNQGERANDVLAKANAGFRFNHWDAGLTTPTLSVRHGIYSEEVHTAHFLADGQVLVSYRAFPAEGGSVQQDGHPIVQQLVSAGGNALPVTAVPASGYRFLYWDDKGITTPVYTQLGVKESMVVTAVFGRNDEYPATIMVLDKDGAGLMGATVTLHGQTLTTDAKGSTPSLMLPADDYPFTVKLAGYQNAEGILKVTSITSKAYATLLPVPTYTVTFEVTSEGKAVERAKVSIAQKILSTNGNGLCTTELPDSTYSYTVRRTGYENATGTVVVKGESLTEKVTLTKKPKQPDAAREISPLAGVEMAPNPCNEELHLQHTELVAWLRIVNSQGVEVLRYTHNGQAGITLPVGALPEGLYLLQLSDNQGGTHTLQFVKL